MAAVLLTNGDVDHVAGLLSLRESQSFRLHATAQTLQALSHNRIFDVINPDFVERQPVEMGKSFEPIPRVQIELFPVPGKVPLWLEDEAPVIGEATESTVGVSISCEGRRIVYIPGCANVTQEVRDRIEGADLLLFDGTLWQDDEMILAGMGRKTGRRMGHVSMSGPEGSMAALAGVHVGCRVFVHINNTNRALIEGSPERIAAASADWDIGFDGMDFAL